MSDDKSNNASEHDPVAHRLVHCCYNSDGDAQTLRFLRDGLGLSAVVTAGVCTYDAGAFGDFGLVRAQLSLVFDERGPRTGAGIELQACIEPPAQGMPYDSIGTPGIQAFGLEVPDVDAAVERAIEYGGTKSDCSGADLDRVLGASGAVSVRDGRGVTFDLVRSESGAGPVRVRHLRLTCRDVDTSARWYQAFGAIDQSQACTGSEVDRSETSWRRLRFTGGDCELILSEWPDAPVGEPYGGPSHRGIYRMALAVDDMSSAVQRMESAGMTLSRPPQRLTMEGTKVPPMLAAFYRDPDGVPVELIERGRSAFR